MLEGISNHYFLGMERPKLETELIWYFSLRRHGIMHIIRS